MTAIAQGSGFRETPSNSQTSSSKESPATTATMTALKDAVAGIQNQSGQSSMGGNNKEAWVNLLQQLIDQIGKCKCDPKPQPQPQPVPLSKQQDKAIRERFNIGGSLSYQVLDSKKDGKLSAGDTLVISGGITGGEISRQKLTAKDVKAINSGSTSTTPQQQLDANRKKWDSLGIDDYSFTLQRSCFCRGDAIRPIDIQVRDGSVTEARYADTGELLPDDRQTNKQSIYNMNADGLFNLVEQGIKSGAAQVDAKYDPKYGLPTSIYIDQSQQIADEEVGYTISNFQPEPTFTTLACGEEGNECYPIDPLPPQEPPIAITKRLGEGDDTGYLGPPIQIKPPVDDPIATTLAIGEEGSSPLY